MRSPLPISAALALAAILLPVIADQASFAAPAPTTPPAPATAPGWLVLQKSQVCGDMQVYLTPAAMKAVDAKTSTTLVSKAPDWKVVVFNRSNKTIYTCPLEKFTGYGLAGMQVQMGFKHGGVPLVRKNTTAKYLGISANVYGTSEQYEKTNRQMYLHDQVSDGMPRTAKMLASSGWGLPASEGIILCRLYGLGDTPDIPLDFHCTDQVNATEEGLSTKLAKKMPVPVKDFEIPTGYTRVDTMEAVRIDATGQTAMEDMLGDLDTTIAGIGNKGAKKKSR